MLCDEYIVSIMRAVIALAIATALPAAAALHAPTLLLRLRSSSSSIQPWRSAILMCDGMAEDKELKVQQMEQELEAKRTAATGKWSEYYGVPNGPSAGEKRAELKEAATQLDVEVEMLEKAFIELQTGKGERTHEPRTHLCRDLECATPGHARSVPRCVSVTRIAAVKYSAVGRMRQKQNTASDPMSASTANEDGGLTGKLNEMWSKLLGGSK